jgi:Uma2 family endonuclease
MRVTDAPSDQADSDFGPMGQMTEKDFVNWSQTQETARAEWINGQVIKSATANDDHDLLQWWCRTLIQVLVDSKQLGVVHGPNFQMRLSTERQRRAPDVLFVATARLATLKPNHLEGPADLVLEVVAPDSKKRDRRDKFDAYQTAAIPEYWIVDPLTDSLEAFALVNDKYRPIPNLDGSYASAIIPGLYIRPRWLWPKNSRTKVTDALTELGVLS